MGSDARMLEGSSPKDVLTAKGAARRTSVMANARGNTLGLGDGEGAGKARSARKGKVGGWQVFNLGHRWLKLRSKAFQLSFSVLITTYFLI